MCVSAYLTVADTDLKPQQVQQHRPKPSVHEDDDLQRALAESMRTFEEEQQHGGGSNMVGRKRSSSPGAPVPHQQQQQVQGHPSGSQQHTMQVQPHMVSQQASVPGGALKRHRSISLPGSSTALCAEGAPAGQTLPGTTTTHTQSMMGQPGGTGTAGLNTPQLRAPLQSLLSMSGLPHSTANATTSIQALWALSKLRGTAQPQQQQVHPQLQQQSQQQQQSQRGLGRSASAQNLAGGEQQVSAELAGSRPSSPARPQQAGAGRPPPVRGPVLPHDLLDDDDDFMDVPSDDDSMSSIAHDSGLPHTISSWGPALLQAAAATSLQQQQGVPRLVGVGPVPGDPQEWCIRSRQFYPNQYVHWQQMRNSWSYPARVLGVDGDGSPAHPVVYTVEVFRRTLDEPDYVEATADQLHPQLRPGDYVWCKPYVAKRAQWSGHGQLFRQLFPPNAAWQRPPADYAAAPWMHGRVKQTQVHQGRNPVAEVQLSGTDACWFITSQLELVSEIGESSAHATARLEKYAERQQQPDAAGGGMQQQQQDTEEVQSQIGQEAPQPAQQQGQPTGCAADGASHQAAAVAAVAVLDQSVPGVAGAAGAEAVTNSLAAPASSPAAAAGSGPDAAGPAGAAAAPSLLSHRAAALTAESGLEAAAPAVTVEQAAGVTMQALLHTQQEGRDAAAANTPTTPTTAAGAGTGVPGVKPGAAGVGAAAVTAGRCPAGAQVVGPPAAAPVLEGTGESAEGLLVEEVVGDSCAGAEGSAEAAAGDVAAAPSPQEPLSNQHSGVEDPNSTQVVREGFGET